MSLLLRVCAVRVSRSAFDRHFGQLICFGAAPALLVLAVRTVCRFATTPGELVIGLLAATGVSLQLVVMGLLLPAAVAGGKSHTAA